MCLIRLQALRPRLGGLVPEALGLRSENAAHRIAVEWDEPGPAGSLVTRQGVYVPRRDTSSRLEALVGGRLLPGVHHRARFDVDEDAEHVRVRVESDDGTTRLSIDVRRTDAQPASLVFPDLATASSFFERAACGFSPRRSAGELEGLELRTRSWQVEPLEVAQVSSSFFDDVRRFPPGWATFDCALLMRGVEHEWRVVEAPAARLVGARHAVRST